MSNLGIVWEFAERTLKFTIIQLIYIIFINISRPFRNDGVRCSSHLSGTTGPFAKVRGWL